MSQDGKVLAIMFWTGLAAVLALSWCVRRWLPVSVKGAIAGIYVLMAGVVLWSAAFGLTIPFSGGPARGWDAVAAVPVVLVLFSLASGGLLLIVPAAIGAVTASVLAAAKRGRLRLPPGWDRSGRSRP